ncbi:LURP-one-related/scramblase family protein [Homoserinimonas sp. A447]
MTDVQHRDRFFVKQRITMMVNRYEIREANADGSEGGIVAIAQQKRMAFKEQVTQAVFSFKARQALDLAAVYDVTDGAGQSLGWFQKDFGASLLRSTFNLGGPGIEARGQERNQAVAIIRRFVEVPLAFHFDFTDKQTGAVVMSSERQFSLRDRYTVTVPDARLDFRLAAAMAVGLDALLQR